MKGQKGQDKLSKKQKGNNQIKSASTAENDNRFKQVFTDPRFMTVPKKVKKVEIDDRFKKGMTSKEFNMVAKVDKYGNKINKQDNSMLKFYNLEKEKKNNKKKQLVEESGENDEEENQEAKEKGKKYYDEEGKFKWDAQSSSEDDQNGEDDQLDEEEDASDSSDEQEEQEELDEEDDDESIWSLQEEQQQPTGDIKVGKRLALTNMDWDNINSVDLLALFSSLCKGDMFITKVEIYPSLFGLEQMKNDTLYGPPKQVFEELPTKSHKKKVGVNDSDGDDFIDDEEKEKLGYNSNKLRKYEQMKMKYFYAVIHCNSKKTASKIYDEYNNFEFEMSNIRLSLSFIDDELTFPQKPKEAATEVPAGYQFRAGSNLNKALNHTNVKLTWDQTDPKRLQKFQKLMEKDNSDLDEDEYKEFLASASEDEEEQDEDAQDKDKIEEYRKKLLGALSSATGEDISSAFRKRDLKAQDDNKEEKDLDIRFNVGFGEDIGKKLLKDKKEKKEKEGESEWQKYQRKRKEKRKEKKQLLKQKKEKSKVEVFEDEDDTRKKAELELLIGKSNNGMGEFKANTKDKRFEAVLKNKEYAIDPTHKNFRKVADGEFIKEQKIKRRKMHEDE